MIHYPEPVASLLVLAFGLLLGSFLNVCIYRLPVGESVVKPRSHCKCGKMIAWYDNIPVLSWLILRARCRHCGIRISWRYPFIEALAGATLVLLWHLFGFTVAFGIAGVFFLAMLVLFFTDWDHHLLPDAVTLTGVLAGLAVAWFNPFLVGDSGWARVWMAFAGACLGSGLLWSVGAIYGKLRGVDAMGMGDVKMMAMVGAFSGPMGVMFTIFAASMVGAVVGVALIPILGRSLQDKLPFGCFLAPAALVALLYGEAAIDAYFRMFLQS